MRARGRDGFILVSVLGALIVLTGLAAAVAYLVRTAATGAAAVRSELTLDALTRSGVAIAGYELFTLRRPADLVNGQQVRLNDGVVTLFVTAETGKIDINTAPPDVLASLWSSIGAPGLLPEQFAARVKDYRDPDAEASDGGGAEAAQYAAAGPDRAPSNAPFDQPDDVQNVLGVPPAAARALVPLLTVHNPGSKISVYAATPQVVRALPDGATLVDKVMAIRARPPAADPSGSTAARGGDGDEEGGDAAKAALGEAARLFSFEQTSAAYAVRVEIARGDARRATDVILTKSRAPDALYFVTDLSEPAAR